MSIDIKTYAERFNRIRAELERVTGDRNISELATLSIVTGLPLLIDSSTSPKVLAEAINGCIKGAVYAGTGTYEKVDSVFFTKVRESNVYNAGDIDQLESRASAFVMVHLSQITGSKVFVVVANTSKLTAPPCTAIAPAAFRDSFGFCVKASLGDIAKVKPVVTREEVVEMREFLDNDGVGRPDQVLSFIVDCGRAANGLDDVVSEELRQYIDAGPDRRASMHLIESAAALAASKARSEVTVDDVRALLEPSFAHRIKPCCVSPYSVSGLGKRVVRELLDKLSAAPPAKDEEDSIL